MLADRCKVESTSLSVCCLSVMRALWLNGTSYGKLSEEVELPDNYPVVPSRPFYSSHISPKLYCGTLNCIANFSRTA